MSGWEAPARVPGVDLEERLVRLPGRSSSAGCGITVIRSCHLAHGGPDRREASRMCLSRPRSTAGQFRGPAATRTASRSPTR